MFSRSQAPKWTGAFLPFSSAFYIPFVFLLLDSWHCDMLNEGSGHGQKGVTPAWSVIFLRFFFGMTKLVRELPSIMTSAKFSAFFDPPPFHWCHKWNGRSPNRTCPTINLINVPNGRNAPPDTCSEKIVKRTPRMFLFPSLPRIPTSRPAAMGNWRLRDKVARQQHSG